MPAQIMIDVHTPSTDGAQIKVIGVGGGGGNAINNMISKGLSGVEFIAANTDKQALDHNLAQIKIQIGADTTRGLGAGANPEIGQKSVEENEDEIKAVLKNTDMLFVTAGMGGGTGTGGAPTIAKIGSEMNALVVGIVTTPFIWEGKKRMKLADEGINLLRQYVDALIVIPNQRLLEIIDKNTSFQEAFLKVDEVLYNATKGISDIIGCHGTVNVDFADVKTVMKGMGDALMGIGRATGQNRAIEATNNALNSPLLNGISIHGAKGVLVNITGGSNLTMHEIAEAVSIVEEAAGEDVNLIHGVVENPDMKDEIMVTVVATGFNKVEAPETTNNNGTNQANNPNQTPPQKPAFFTPTRPSFGIPRTDTVATTQPTLTRVTGSPRGYDELKKYDEPAFKRKQREVQSDEPASTNSMMSTSPFARKRF
jgi:cell division protein FtsZ